MELILFISRDIKEVGILLLLIYPYSEVIATTSHFILYVWILDYVFELFLVNRHVLRMLQIMLRLISEFLELFNELL
jgi:hypothetical protein